MACLLSFFANFQEMVNLQSWLDKIQLLHSCAQVRFKESEMFIMFCIKKCKKIYEKIFFVRRDIAAMFVAISLSSVLLPLDLE
jgi:hypothetical protein